MCRFLFCVFFFFKQKTAYEMRISDWSSDVCSESRYAIHLLDLASGKLTLLSKGSSQDSEPAWSPDGTKIAYVADGTRLMVTDLAGEATLAASVPVSTDRMRPSERSEEHTSELQSLMRISYAVFCLKKK